MQILKPCASCGETLIFAHPAPKGDIEPLGDGKSRVRCPACHAEGPVSEGFRDACNRWNAMASSATEPAPSAIGNPADEVPNNRWPIHSSLPTQPAPSTPPL